MAVSQEQFQALMAQNQELQAGLLALQGRLQTAEQRLGARQPGSQIDVRTLGKPEAFNGTGSWKDWSVVMRAYTAACYPEIVALMEMAEVTDDPVENSILRADARGLSVQLYYILVMVCRESALTRVVNSGVTEGLCAWRALCRFHEPKSAARQAALLQDLLAFSMEGDIQAKLAQFERDCARYEHIAKAAIGDSIKVGIVVRQMKDGLIKQHLLLNLDRFDSYAKVKEELEAVARAQATASSVPMPMDINPLGTTKGVKGKGKGRGDQRGDKSAVTCHHCGKKGHYKKDCWQLQGGKGRGGKGGGKSGHGGGEATGKGQSSSGNSVRARKCWNCGQSGHEAKQCPKSRPVAAITTDVPTTSPSVPSTTVSGLFLSPLVLDSVEAQGDAGQVTFGIDSGAAVSVLPLGCVAHLKAAQDALAGRTYESATGQKVVDHGEVRLFGRRNGSLKVVKARRVDVRKPLLAVADMVDQGTRLSSPRAQMGKTTRLQYTR